MIRNYAGVGRKTAEKLLEEFGEDVFRVIDEQPERLSRVLPQHRAQAVVEAREAEREQRAT
jgi:5'-3' exonuclease